VTVNVVGYQWSWQFNYPQDKVTENGVMYPGPLPVLELPTGETVRFNLTSPDVIHSFWVPEFLFKRDVIPGHPNHFEITLTKTGTFTGHCSELCGLYHSRMLFTLKVVTPQQFQQWIAAQKKSSPSSGQPTPEPSSTGGTGNNGLGGSGGGQDAKTAIRSGAK
jgi:cytochrome c oxidase subunit 2